jgi:hypothetical protein
MEGELACGRSAPQPSCAVWLCFWTTRKRWAGMPGNARPRHSAYTHLSPGTFPFAGFPRIKGCSGRTDRGEGATLARVDETPRTFGVSPPVLGASYQQTLPFVGYLCSAQAPRRPTNRRREAPGHS